MSHTVVLFSRLAVVIADDSNNVFGDFWVGVFVYVFHQLLERAAANERPPVFLRVTYEAAPCHVKKAPKMDRIDSF